MDIVHEQTGLRLAVQCALRHAMFKNIKNKIYGCCSQTNKNTTFIPCGVACGGAMRIAACNV